jgi:hypothetical protein
MDWFIVKKILFGIVLYSSAIIGCAILQIGFFTFLWYVGVVIENVNDRFGNSQFIMALISASAVIITAVIAKRQRTASVSANSSKNAMIYTPLTNDIITLMKTDKDKLDRKEFKKISEKHLPGLVISASKSIVNYLYYINHYCKQGASTIELLFLCEHLLNAMRRELGQPEIESGYILSIYSEESDKQLRKKYERQSGWPHIRLF